MRHLLINKQSRKVVEILAFKLNCSTFGNKDILHVDRTNIDPNDPQEGGEGDYCAC